MSKIRYSQNALRWELVNLETDLVIAFCNETTDYPFGTQKWYFNLTQHNCKEEGQNWKKLIFHQAIMQPGTEKDIFYKMISKG